MKKNNLFFYYAILPALLIPTIFTFLYFIVFSQNLTGKIIYGLEKIFMIVFPLFWVYQKRISFRPAGKGRTGDGSSIHRGRFFDIQVLL